MTLLQTQKWRDRRGGMLHILILKSVPSVCNVVCSRNSCKSMIIIMLNNAATFHLHLLPGSQAALDYYMKQQFLSWKIGPYWWVIHCIVCQSESKWWVVYFLNLWVLELLFSAKSEGNTTQETLLSQSLRMGLWKETGSGPRSFLPDSTLMRADCPVPSPCQADMHSNDPNWCHYTNNLISIIQVWAAD